MVIEYQDQLMELLTEERKSEDKEEVQEQEKSLALEIQNFVFFHFYSEKITSKSLRVFSSTKLEVIGYSKIREVY